MAAGYEICKQVEETSWPAGESSWRRIAKTLHIHSFHLGMAVVVDTVGMDRFTALLSYPIDDLETQSCTIPC